MKKITLITTLLLCLMMTLNACSSYRDDVAVNDLTSEILNSVSTQGGYTAMDELFLSLEFANPSLIESDVSEWMICAFSSLVFSAGSYMSRNTSNLTCVACT